MPNDQFEINGQIVGTGLLIPVSTASSSEEWSKVHRTYSYDDLKDHAKKNDTRGSTRFDKTYIKNQRSHGSCNGFMGAAMLTRARVRRGLKRVDLSGAYLYSLINGGRDRGSMLDDGMNALQGGCATEETVKWNQIYPRLYNKAKADAEAKNYRAFECYAIRNELELFSALATGWDCGVAVHADNGFMKLDSRGVAQGGRGPGNHAVGCDGYWFDERSNELIADMYNSWDLVYGREGRAGITWVQHCRHTIQYHAFYAIRSTSDGEENPPMPRP